MLSTLTVSCKLPLMTRDVCFPLTIGFLCLFCFCRLSFLCWNLHGGIIKYKPSKKSRQTIPNFSEIWMLGIVSHCPLAAVEQNHTLVCCLGFILPSGAQHQLPLQALATWGQRSGSALGFTGSLVLPLAPLTGHSASLCKGSWGCVTSQVKSGKSFTVS